MIDWRAVGPGSPLQPFNSNGVQTVDTPFAPLRNFGRAFFGEAAAHNGATDGNVTGGSWLQNFSVNGRDVTDWDFAEDNGQVVSVARRGIAVVGAVRTNLNAHGYGATFLALNNGSGGKQARGFYVDAAKAHAAAGSTWGGEIQASNHVGPSPTNGGATPYFGADGQIGVLALGAGSDPNTFGSRSYAIDYFLKAVGNGSAAFSGIIFENDALMREISAWSGTYTDDTTAPRGTGFARAMAMACGQGLSWYAPVGTKNEVFRIKSAITSPSNRMELVANNGGIHFYEQVSPGSTLFSVKLEPDAVAHLYVQAASFGAPILGVQGRETNIDLKLVPQGGGYVQFGTFTPAATTIFNCIGYFSHKAATGVVYKLAVIA